MPTSSIQTVISKLSIDIESKIAKLRTEVADYNAAQKRKGLPEILDFDEILNKVLGCMTIPQNESVIKMPKIHELKIRPGYFKDVLSGKKKFEIRRNDRDFTVGDFIILEEYDEISNGYTGEKAYFKITYILADPEFLKPGFAALGIEPCTFADMQEGSAQDNET